MDPDIASLLGYIESRRETMTDQQYTHLLTALTTVHEQTEESLRSAQRLKEQQIREDEIVARSMSEIQQAPAHRRQSSALNSSPTTIPNHDMVVKTVKGVTIKYYVQDKKYNSYEPGVVYHRMTKKDDAISHRIRNPQTGIYVLYDRDRGKSILLSHGLVPLDLHSSLPSA